MIAKFISLFFAIVSIAGKCEGYAIEDKHFAVVADDSIKPKEISFFLYTWENRNDAQIFINGNEESLNHTFFNMSKETKILVHGWYGNAKDNFNIMVKNAFLELYDVNIICVDWSSNSIDAYDTVVKVVPNIGKELSNLIDWLVKLGTPIQSFHLIGFSLGAHVVGCAARYCKQGKIEFITGLDPAKDHFEKSHERIDRNDAKYVEIIHTDSRRLNLAFPLGHNDFYPNGGAFMPGCEEDGCSHCRAYEYYAESLDHKGFMAWQCANYEEISAGKCSNISSLHMGGSKPKNPVGVFYLQTNAHSKYYQSQP